MNHLNCFGRYYTEEFLHFLHEWTGIAPIVELMASLDDEYRFLIDYLDFERSFVDGTCWIVPFTSALDAQAATSAFMNAHVDFSALPETSLSRTVRMPAEGLHIEATAGECVFPTCQLIRATGYRRCLSESKVSLFRATSRMDRSGPGKAGRAGQGRAGQGRAGQGRAGQGRAGQGRAGRDLVVT